MNRRFGFIGGSLLTVLILFGPPARADSIDLFQWIFNVDGTLYDSTGVLGSSLLPSRFNQTPAASGAQGSLTIMLTGAGTHHFAGFYDYELDQTVNGFSNEFGAAFNLAAQLSGMTWEIDEPGFVFGDIYDHIQSGAASLDNNNGVPLGFPDDPSVALGWQFQLSAGEFALITILVSDSAPASGFYLQQVDPDTGTSLYYSSSLEIGPAVETPVAEPSSLVLLITGFGIAGAFKRYQCTRCLCPQRLYLE
jgi:hypothetical protein